VDYTMRVLDCKSTDILLYPTEKIFERHLTITKIKLKINFILKGENHEEYNI